MKQNNKKYITRTSRLIFIYGIYSIICHIFLSALYCDHISKTQPLIFERLFFTLFEYSLVSLVIVVVGGLLVDIYIKQKSVDT